ncbi:MAG: hypothetical protein KDA41_13095, partial [Planctomycetales bacterium]|nr:hypothetical protein [Planctomycetales bacterium]
MRSLRRRASGRHRAFCFYVCRPTCSLGAAVASPREHATLRAFFVFACLALSALGQFGCRRSTNIDALQRRNEKSLSGSQEHLARSIDMLERIEQFDPNQAATVVLAQLRQWINDQDPADDWSADPLLFSMPSRYDALKTPQQLKQLQFMPDDFLTLREAIWMRNVARWQTEERDRRRRELADSIQLLQDSLADDKTATGAASLSCLQLV